MTIDVLHTNQRLLVEEINKRGIDVTVIDKQIELVLCQSDTHKEFLFDRYSSLTSHTAVQICADKFLTKQILQLNTISVPRGGVFDCDDTQNIVDYCTQYLHYPLVIKPNWGSHGDNVFLGIQHETQLLKCLTYFREAYKKNTSCVIEEHIQGQEYRIFITRENKYAVTYREPAYIIGTGVHTIQELIDRENETRKDRSRYALYPIQADVRYMAKNNIYLDTIPMYDEKIYVRNNSNIATGGVCIDVTDDVHPHIIDICYQALCSFPGMAYAGIDLIIDHISSDPYTTPYAIIEVNSNPSLSIHMLPRHGTSRNVASYIVDMLFPHRTHHI